MKKQIDIHPAILVENIKDYFKQINAAAEYCNWVDIDIIDWERTDKKTILVQEALAVPDKIRMNFDLMMDYPSEAIKKLVKDERVVTIIINISQKEDINYLIDVIKSENKNVGFGINPENDVSDIKNIIERFDHLQIYTVEPGKQSNPFISGMLEKILMIKKTGFKGTIGVDGGIGIKTANKLLGYPIDFVSVGSALSKAENPKKVYHKLIKKINK